jgi:hypothetical protein
LPSNQNPLGALPSRFRRQRILVVGCGDVGLRVARALPRRVREEGYAIARAGPESLRAPVQSLHFYHQTLHLLGARGTAARSDAPTVSERAAGDGRQIEMPLRAAGG